MTETARPAPASSAASTAADRELRFRYTAQLAGEIETRWQAWWEAHQTFRALNPGDAGFDPAQRKFYCLDMFPYPSGAGLHVGHPLGYVASDIVSRYRRLRGENVLHPMGWDAFGLPAEQYAIQTGVHPAETTRSAIETFRRQLRRFGLSYDWSREIATIDPGYYRWTQWIWLQAYDAWYDHVADRARPIAELLDLLERRHAWVGPDGALVMRDGAPQPPAGALAWEELGENERRRFIDGQRLAYLDEQTVNWCPKLGTVLANEEVIDGRSERGGYPVHRRPLRQWMFRITAYAERLLRDLEHVDWPESTRTMQSAWIGRSEGAEIDFALAADDAGAPVSEITSIRVFTTRPDTIFGATFMVIAPEHPLVGRVLEHGAPGGDGAALLAYVEAARQRSDVDRMAETKRKTGVFSGGHAINPATGRRIPVWIADYVLIGYGHGAIMAVPGHDQRDFEFARAFDLPVVTVVRPEPGDTAAEGEAFEGAGIAVNSAGPHISIDGLPTERAKQKTIEWLERSGAGRRRINYKLRDWLFSRQRYWGEPFPIVYDRRGDHYAVDEANLPVLLPPLEDYRPVESPDPAPLLAKATQWVQTTAGEAGVSADVLPPAVPVTRETNTMPGWAGSCWYYLRFCDPGNEERFIDAGVERYWMVSAKGGGATQTGETWDARRHHTGGVDLYIGGAEHSVLHLLYARFWHKLLFDLGHVSTPEPFGRLFHQGLITAFAYEREDRSLVPVDEVEPRGEEAFVERATGRPVTRVAAKMSKSLKNVVNPDDVIAEYGADTFRLYEMYMGPLEASKPWNPRDIVGPFRFLQRVWRLVVDEQSGEPALREEPDEQVEKLVHRTIAKVEQEIERLSMNTAIAAMFELVNAATAAGGLTADQAQRFAVILSPFAPHVAEEIWANLGQPAPVARAAWPEHDPAMLADELIELPVQIQGKVRGRIRIAPEASTEEIERAALGDERIAEIIAGRPVRKVIVVPGRIVNVIV